MYLPDGSAFTLAILIGAVAGANIALLATFTLGRAVSIHAMPRRISQFAYRRPLADQRVPKAILDPTVRGWSVITVAALAIALLAHVANIGIEGVSAHGPNGQGYRIESLPTSDEPSAQEPSAGAGTSEVLGGVRFSVPGSVNALEGESQRTVTTIVVAILIVGTMATLNVLLKLAQETPPVLGQGPIAGRGEAPTPTPTPLPTSE